MPDPTDRSESKKDRRRRLQVNVSADARDLLRTASQRSGIYQQDLADLLIRSLSVEQIIELVVAQRDRDREKRAGQWADRKK